MTFSVATLANSGVLVTWMILSDSTEDLKVSVEGNLVGFVTLLFGEDEAEAGVGVVFDLVDSEIVGVVEGLDVLGFVVVNVGLGFVVVVDVVSGVLVAAVVDNWISLVVVVVIVVVVVVVVVVVSALRVSVVDVVVVVASAFGVSVVVVVMVVGLMDVIGE